MKLCKKCGISKNYSCFSACSKHKDGLQHSCKECNKAYRQANKQKLKGYQSKYYQSNREELLSKSKVWQTLNADHYKTRLRAWSKNNRNLKNFHEAKRRALKLKATPSWLNEAQLEQIAYYYWLAKDLKITTGEQYHVDHIIPLQGEIVCGLHVPWNLQLLPSDINIAKGNNFKYDMRKAR
jgi:hypothetical protein